MKNAPYKNGFEHLNDICRLFGDTVAALSEGERAAGFGEGLARIAEREKNAPVRLPILSVRERFGLNDYENVCFLLSAAVCADEAVGDVLSKWTGGREPSFGLAAALLSLCRETSGEIFGFLAPNRPLSYLTVSNADGLASRRFKLRNEVFHYITGNSVSEDAHLTFGEKSPAKPDLYPLQKGRIIGILNSLKSNSGKTLIALCGNKESDKTKLALQSCEAVGKGAVFADLDGEADFGELCELARKTVCLCVMTESLPVITSNGGNSVAKKFAALLPPVLNAVFLCAAPKEELAAPRGFSVVEIALPSLTKGTGAAEWNYRADGTARVITPPFGIDEVVAGEKTKSLFKKIIATFKHKEKLYGEYGYGKLFPYGRGIGVLFHGSSGTGKTMAAMGLARELGLDLMVADLSGVVDKYIGETEKRVSRIFEKAEESGCVLFFDEADSLFSKRVEVGSAHDRHANTQTAHLLQKTEEYDGLVVLATNLIDNVDDAFKRRLPFIVEFPRPDAGLREILWRRFITEETPRDDIDFGYLSETFELSPAAIRWAAFSSCVRAVSENVKLSTGLITETLEYEYEKSGASFPDKAYDDIIL